MGKNRKYLALSLFCHLLFMMTFMPIGCSKTLKGEKSQKNEKAGSMQSMAGNHNVEIKIIEREPPPDPVDKTPERDLTEKSEIITKQQSLPKPNDCKKWYGGIGVAITVTTFGVRLDKVYPGYPAWKAGLNDGDVVIWVEGGEITGPPGTVVTLQVMRDGMANLYNITRGRICY